MTKIYLAKDPTDEPIQRPQVWRGVVTQALEELGGEACLERLYAKVKELAPMLTSSRPHWKPKVRQVVQRTPSIEHVSRGVWRLRPSGDTARTRASNQPKN